MVPISYSVGHEYLHHLLASYKRLPDPRSAAAQEQIAAILGRFLVRHEACLATAAKAEHFDVVTTVPSSDRDRDDGHPLRRIVGEMLEPTVARHVRLLRRTAEVVELRCFDSLKFAAEGRLDGASVLLIDDTWTTGANAESAAAALKRAGATTVAALVIGRHVNRDWHENDRQIDRLSFDWDACGLCAREVQARHAA
jgi:adenine/guanine phosphoribosyltransferase-like PRPP-binding protein